MSTKSQRTAIVLACVGVFCALDTSASQTFPICGGDKPVFNDGLCYPSCPAEMWGLGPLCYGHCPHDFRDDGLFCNKPTQTRKKLAGKPLTPKCDSMRILMDFCAIPNAGQDMTELARFAGNNALAISATMVPSAEKNLMVEELGKFLACTVAQMKSLTEHFATPSAIPGTMALVPFAGNIVIQASLITGRLVLSTFSTGTSSPLMAVALVRYPIIDAAPTKIMMLACVILSARQGTMASDPSAGWVALQLMTDIGVSCTKKSYGRTAGTVPKYVCEGPNEENVDELCLDRCKNGYDAVGVTCFKKCPARMADIGISCAKNTKGRGVGVVPPQCTSSSFKKSYTVPEKIDPFAMVIMNDPQLVWWEIAGCEKADKDCKRKAAEKEAASQIHAINKISTLRRDGATLREPRSVVINGDLTSYFHTHEYSLFNKYYTKASNDPSNETLRYPIMPGLGNHDYQNNVGGCTFLTEPHYGIQANYGCASKAVDLIRGAVSCNAIPDFPAEKIESYDEDSAAYSWNEGKYHFVQLHNYPYYTIPQIGLKPSMNWFMQDISAATARGQPIVVNVHQSHQFNVTEWEIEEQRLDSGAIQKIIDHRKAEFEAALRASNVVAIFAGHYIRYESSLGYQGELAGVPVFRGGHAGQDAHGKFLHVEFHSDFLQVGTMQSYPSFGFHDEGNAKYHRIVNFTITP
eukprot:CAMPEP_0184549346 /NCGR_PEP_ID=MMETSP0199_2-20130426/9541_1 /TAXON_ID=1112570 /ORGANISM="Thraustochytrium sp., Strain LLF1b" /LENGTH=690 /DNA_ID=CAMNT_0026944063 /DNA_START=100 /DNA_END=2172 /DNA_ORIENTATION=+